MILHFGLLHSHCKHHYFYIIVIFVNNSGLNCIAYLYKSKLQKSWPKNYHLMWNREKGNLQVEIQWEWAMQILTYSKPFYLYNLFRWLFNNHVCISFDFKFSRRFRAQNSYHWLQNCTSISEEQSLVVTRNAFGSWL